MACKTLSLMGGLAAALSIAVAPIALQAADDLLHSGTFEGASGHETSGGVTIVSTDNGIQVILGEDFYHDGAPDPHVGFGTNGSFDSASDLGMLAANTGEQVYDVPATLDISGYDEVYIWCVQYSVPLGVASLR
ncbi:MAG: DM13 domain-containing protein [Pseudomonadota bacterium]